jgi:hypothetical protein
MGLLIRIEQNVPGLQVTVQNAPLMRVMDGSGDFSD